MTKPTDPKVLERLAKADQLNRAYRVVFGTDDARSGAQELVFQDLMTRCKFKLPTTVADADGRIDPLASAMNEGKRLVFLGISERINQKPRLENEEKD